jgi:hypothetical protein
MKEAVQFRNPVKGVGFAQVFHAVAMDKRISDGALRTFLLYLKYAQQNESCWPSRKRLSEERGKDQATITRHTTELEAAGYITRVRRTGKTSLTYIEDIEQIPELNTMAQGILEERAERREDHGRKNAPTDSAKTRPPTAQECAPEEEPLKKNQETIPPAADSWDDIPLVKEINVTEVKSTGFGKAKRFSFRCSTCYDDVLINAVGEQKDCTCGEVYKLVRPRPQAGSRVPHGFKDPILDKGATLALECSKHNTRSGGWWGGFYPKQLAAWKDLMLNSHKRAPTNWEKWLVHCREVGDTGRGLVLHAFNGFKQQGGGPPPRMKQQEEKLELTEEALGL